jgi:hypothetical protein
MTHTAKHTPGPWQAYNLHKGRTLKHWVVDTGTGKVTLDDAAHWEAGNAHLIAAAPAMYEALQATLAYFMRSNQSHAPEVQAIRTALAQAEGKHD